MRVLVVSDTIGALTSMAAGRALASGWPQAGVTVLPAGEAGGPFVRAWAEDRGVEVVESVAGDQLIAVAVAGAEAAVGVQGPPAGDGIAYAATSRPLGEALQTVLTGPVRRAYLDLGGAGVHDGGAGLLAALGASADRPLDSGVEALTGLTRLDLAPVRRTLGEVELVGVVPADQLGQPLLGLRGITSLSGRSSGQPAEWMLATDAALGQLSALAGPAYAGQPGAGACGGLGFAVLALGGRLSTGASLALGSERATAALRGTDLVLTGCSVFDFHSRGGGVVAAAAEAASTALSPCVVVAGEVVIGGREMRTMGVEAAYAVRESTLGTPGATDITEAELVMMAHRVARSWSW